MILKYTRPKGFTLIELLITLSILTILAGIAVPTFHEQVSRSKRDASISALYHIYQLGRRHAIDNQRLVHFCGSNDLLSCEKKWSKYAVIFIDADRNNQPSEQEIVSVHHFTHKSIRFVTRSGFGKRYTVFRRDGTVQLAGSMIYCGDKRVLSSFQRLTWNRVGRPYIGVDKNGDRSVDGIEKYIKDC